MATSESPLISIVVPVYNVENELPKCVDSLIRQTYRNIEIILVDDGSTDQSGTLCDEYAAKDERIIVHHQQNGGLSAARNSGLDIASGDWLGFIDSDDYAEPDMFSLLIRAALDSNTKLAACGFRRQHLDGSTSDTLVPKNPAHILQEKAFEHMLHGTLSGAVWNKLFHHETVRGNRFDTSIRLNEDGPYTAKAIAACPEGVAYVPKALYNYVTREGALSKTFAEKHITAIDALEQTVAVVAPVSKKAERMAKAHVAFIAAILAIKAGGKGEHVETIKRRGRKYLKYFWLPCGIGLPTKVLIAAVLFFPSLGARMWRLLKRG